VAGGLGRSMETVAAGTVAGALVRASAIRAGVVPAGVEAAVLLVDRIEGTEVSSGSERTLERILLIALFDALFHLPADEGASHGSIYVLGGPNLRGVLHADWLCMVHDTVPAAPVRITHFVSPSS